MKRQIVTQDESVRTKAIVRALINLGKGKSQNTYHSVNAIYLRSTSSPSGVTITASDISRILDPLVERRLVKPTYIEDAYNNRTMTCYAVNQSRIKQLERILG